MDMSVELLNQNRSFGGWLKQYSHHSSAVNCNMRFSIFLPPQVSEGKKVPVVYWLSGLTCTDENFMQKSGAQRVAAELGIAIVAPDTSPRGDEVSDDPDNAYDLGKGAGFYVNATEAPWKPHYQMYDYIVTELPQLIETVFPVTALRSISGHSMGGHGALMIALRNNQRYQSVSAFSPISHPSKCPWGQKAFSAYLGKSIAQWKQYDACELLKEGKTLVPALVDQGKADDFLQEQLKPELLIEAVKDNKATLDLRMHEGYDHSYFFIASFIEDHLRFHAKHLGIS